MWADLRAVFAFLSASPDCRTIILTGSGKGFTGGLDLHDHADLFAPHSLSGSDSARQAFSKLPLIHSYQDSVSSLERARVPVIAAVHGACVGGGVDLICAADIRLVLHHTFIKCFSIARITRTLAAWLHPTHGFA
jgi:enoyl-CoA hydratase/carnithine racemase